MANCSDKFREFLSNIEPDSKAVEYAQEAHLPVRQYLENDDYGDNVEGSFLYGSYKRHTAVGGIKDVDIVLLCNIDTVKTAPIEALTQLKNALSKHYKLPNNEEIQSRSIKVNQPVPDSSVELTLDIVPGVINTNEDEPILVPDRELGKWKFSHPKGHIKNAIELNSEAVSSGNFIPLVKIVKWWWKFQAEKNFGDDGHRPKGFWLECLVANYFDPDCKTYAENFQTFLTNVSEAFEIDSEVPQLPDPGMLNETISTGMEQQEFNEFLTVLRENLVLTNEALAETDKGEACLKWREIFGDEFPLAKEDESKSSLILGDVSHQQQPTWPIEIQYQTTIVSCTGVSPLNKEVNVGNFPISDGYDLTYTAETNVPEPYQVYWQVVNTGDHAREEGINGLRGWFDEPKNPNNPLQQKESSKYTGKHWIQCFIVKDEMLVSVSNKFFISVVHRKRKFKKIRT